MGTPSSTTWKIFCWVGLPSTTKTGTPSGASRGRGLGTILFGTVAHPTTTATTARTAAPLNKAIPNAPSESPSFLRGFVSLCFHSFPVDRLDTPDLLGILADGPVRAELSAGS